MEVETTPQEESKTPTTKTRHRRRYKKGAAHKPAEAVQTEETPAPSDATSIAQAGVSEQAQGDASSKGGRKRPRRRRPGSSAAQAATEAPAVDAPVGGSGESATAAAAAPAKSRRRGRRKKPSHREDSKAEEQTSIAATDDEMAGEVDRVMATAERLDEAEAAREDDFAARAISDEDVPELSIDLHEVEPLPLGEPHPLVAAEVPAAAEHDDYEAEELDRGELEREVLDSDLEIQPYAQRPETRRPSKDKQAEGGRELIINVSAGYECRVAVLHEGRLEELFLERQSTLSHVGNIYKGKVTNVEPSIQAAFVDFGLPKNGFLHISDVQPQYFPNHGGGSEDVGRKIPRHHRPPIQKCFRRGQEVIVQITKEGVGTKGPTLTTYLSIPGRYLVMMPGMSHHGVSRKIEDDDARRRMRDVLGELKLPKGMGFILRTAGQDRNKRDLQRDLQYLLRLWKTVADRIKRFRTPAELYRESDLVVRTLRDVYTSEFGRIVVDDPVTAKKVREFLRIAMPRTRLPIELYTDREPLFHRLGIEAEIERINMRHVPLASGGSLVIDSTEAMVAIDVNSGRFRSIEDAEETALRINMEAAEEIARQLRLRDLGGLIVCDFIDMRHDRNKRKVEQSLRDALKKHKERARTLRMSAFGLIEMTRQRQGPSIRRNMYQDCPQCRGTGHVKLPETVMLDAIRILQLAAHHEQTQKISIMLAPEAAFRMLNLKRSLVNQIETETNKRIVIEGNPSFSSDQIEVACEDARGREVIVTGASPAPTGRTRGN